MRQNPAFRLVIAPLITAGIALTCGVLAAAPWWSFHERLHESDARVRAANTGAAIVARNLVRRRPSLEIPPMASEVALADLLTARIPSWRLTRLQRERIARVIAIDAPLHGLDPLLVLAVIRTESRFDPNAVSSVGAQGLMQLMPGTALPIARRLHARTDARFLFDPETNVRVGIRFLEWLRNHTRNMTLALASYNAGPHAVHVRMRDHGVLPENWQRFADDVLRYQRKLARRAPDIALVAKLDQRAKERENELAGL